MVWYLRNHMEPQGPGSGPTRSSLLPPLGLHEEKQVVILYFIYIYIYMMGISCLKQTLKFRFKVRCHFLK